jgi:hypothetical protein
VTSKIVSTSVKHACCFKGECHDLDYCYNSFPGRPDQARAKIDNNCCRANLSREHVRSLVLDQWVEDKHVKGCIRLEVCKLTRKGLKDPTSGGKLRGLVM